MNPTTADAPSRPDPADGPGPLAALGAGVRKVLKPLASLQLTCALFVFSVLLVFFGTVAQKNSGLWTVVDRYFWSIYVWVDSQLIVQVAQVFLGVGQNTHWTWAFPLPGGKLLGGLLALNLLAAHLVRFKFSWKRSGVIVLHAGLLLLFVGEAVTREFAVEQRMSIDEGQAVNYAEDSRHVELAFTDHSNPAEDTVVVVSQARLLRDPGQRITHPDLPVDVEVVSYFPNAALKAPAPGDANPATAGLGQQYLGVEKPEVSGVDPNQRVDLPAAYVKLYKKGTDEVVGTYLTALELALTRKVESLTVDGKPVTMALRFARNYKPFSLYLVDFKFDRYTGTSTPRNYSSDLILVDNERGLQRNVRIAMNDPLYFRGETYYQGGFDDRTETTTVLQVVHNPGWLIPWVSCIMVSFGMLLHFGLNLGTFLGRLRAPAAAAGKAAPPPARTATERFLPWVAVVVCGLYLLSNAVPRAATVDGMDLRAAGLIPVVEGGRVKPLDTAARVDMRVMNTREEFEDEQGRKRPAIQWYFDAASHPGRDAGPAAKYRLFRVEHDQVREIAKLERREGMRYSMEELRKNLAEWEAAARKAKERPEKDRDLFEQKLVQLYRQGEVFIGAQQGFAPLVLPPAVEGGEWRSVMEEEKGHLKRALAIFKADPSLPPMFKQADDAQVMEMLSRAAGLLKDAPKDDPFADKVREMLSKFEAAQQKADEGDPAAAAWQRLLSAYRAKDVAAFNDRVREYKERFYGHVSTHDKLRVQLEGFLNAFAPFYHCTGLYVVAFLLAAAGWATVPFRPSLGEAFRRTAFWVLALTFTVHMVSLLARMYLMGRPLVFVTNLYSSAVFIGCAAVGICLLIEKVFPIGIGNAVAAALGFGTCVIAHNLAIGGDTLEMMQAVLDTNFWLATHVTTVTLGYSATYVAGAIGLAYVLLGLFTKTLAREVPVGAKTMPVGRVMGMILYAVVCGATLLSFVGTVLGGIWADFSWGRFWGWDPKENGAVLIVLWNALILHARWCGLVKDRGMAVLSLVGNMITTWSWFGTNQLGVGLHAYGFNNTLAFGCTVVWATHLVLIAAGLVPQSLWLSFRRPPSARPSAA